jgi:hypothetical protein
VRENEDEWADLMRRGNAGDSGAYRQLLKALPPVLRAVTHRAWREPDSPSTNPRRSFRTSCSQCI